MGRELIIGQTTGVPQGLVLGSVLWNIFNDEVPATDLGIESLKSKVEVTRKSIDQWMDGDQLKFAPKKKMLKESAEISHIETDAKCSKIC